VGGAAGLPCGLWSSGMRISWWRPSSDGCSVHRRRASGKMYQSRTSSALSWATRASCLPPSVVPPYRGWMVRLCWPWDWDQQNSADRCGGEGSCDDCRGIVCWGGVMTQLEVVSQCLNIPPLLKPRFLTYTLMTCCFCTYLAWAWWAL